MRSDRTGGGRVPRVGDGRRETLVCDDRAVSTAVGYVLSLAIMALLISGLLIAGGNFLDNERDRVARDQLNVLSEEVAGGVENADRMAGASDGSPVVFVRVNLPSRIAGSQYRITVNNATGAMAPDRPYAYELVLEATSPDITAERRLTVRTHHPANVGTVAGGDIVIGYHDAGDGKELSILKEMAIDGAEAS